MKKILCLYCMMFLLGEGLYAQPSNVMPIGEMLHRLSYSKPDSARVDWFLRISDHYLNSIVNGKSTQFYDSSFFYLQQALQLSEKIHHKGLQIRSLGHMSHYYFTRGEIQNGKNCLLACRSELERAGKIRDEIHWLTILVHSMPVNDTTSDIRLDCLNRVISLHQQLGHDEECMAVKLDIADTYFVRGLLNAAERQVLSTLSEHKSLRAHSYSNAHYLLSVINRYKGNLHKALQYSMTAIRSAEKIKDSSQLDYLYGELALVYDDLGFYEQSIEWYRRSVKLREQTLWPFVFYNTASLLIRQYIKTGRLKEALDLLNSLPHTVPPLTNMDRFMLTNVTANYYYGIKKYDLAEKYYVELDAIETQFDGEHYTVAYQDMGNFYLTTRRFDKARKYFLKAYNSADGSIELSRRRELAHELFLVDSSDGQLLSAIGHLREFQRLGGEIFTEDKNKLVEELQVQTEVEKKENNIQLLENERKVREGTLTQIRYTRNSIFMVLILLVLVVCVLFVSYNRKQRTNRILESQQKEIREHTVSLQHFIKEKEWLVKEIHHRVKNNLHTISGLLDTQYGFLKTDDARLAFSDSQHRVHAISLMHQKLFQSKDLSSIEMKPYISELVEYLQHWFRVGPHIRFVFDVDNVVFGISRSLPVGLIVTEAVTNALKYGFEADEAGVITLRLKQNQQEGCVLIISDNGKGLPAEIDTGAARSMGTSLMRKLAQDMGGVFSAHNHQGTEISVSFVCHNHVYQRFSTGETQLSA